ncbi:MAG: TlyA family RNA methyltransferase [Butyrivibrio sp.]|nr:TlyA family RNA methyltransferase [Butyrivibrio sp.]
MAKGKERLDVLLVNRGLAPSREKAKTLIMAGDVFVNGQREDKPGTSFDEEKITSLEVRGDTLPYVSRGGLKLEKAVNNFGFSLEDKVCMDIGASTGGFTDCMLQNGAKKVYSVDVGHGQLDWKLRSDDRVVCMEKTNFRYMVRDDIEDDLDFASCDVSFISLTKILLPARKLLKDGGQMVCLIKPQFEAGKDKVGKKGVVRDPKVHEEVVHRIVDFVHIAGFDVLHLDYSPIKGPEGNIEYLVHIMKNPDMNESVLEMTEADGERLLKSTEESGDGYSHTQDMEKLISDIVLKAHGSLDKS